VWVGRGALVTDCADDVLGQAKQTLVHGLGGRQVDLSQYGAALICGEAAIERGVVPGGQRGGRECLRAAIPKGTAQQSVDLSAEEAPAGEVLLAPAAVETRSSN
jgi:hypothetical protein